MFSDKGSLNHACAGELAWTAQINIWVMLADLYLKMDKPMQAVSAIDEAAQIAAAHPEVLYYVSYMYNKYKYSAYYYLPY